MCWPTLSGTPPACESTAAGSSSMAAPCRHEAPMQQPWSRRPPSSAPSARVTGPHPYPGSYSVDTASRCRPRWAGTCRYCRPADRPPTSRRGAASTRPPLRRGGPSRVVGPRRATHSGGRGRRERARQRRTPGIGHGPGCPPCQSSPAGPTRCTAQSERQVASLVPTMPRRALRPQSSLEVRQQLSRH